VNGKAVNGRSVDEVLKDLVGDEGHALEISLRAADEAKSQVRHSLFDICLFCVVSTQREIVILQTTDTLIRSLSSSALQFLAAVEMAAVVAPAVANPLVRFLLFASFPFFSPQSPSSHPASLSGVGISFVRRTGAAAVDSKFVVKRLVQGSDTALQGDVEVNDVVVKVRQRSRIFVSLTRSVLQVDGHPVKGWDEKALLAHVMGEEGKQSRLKRSSFNTSTILTQCLFRHVLQHRI
jgi:C-terminal processing protease CtpA/Prc